MTADQFTNFISQIVPAKNLMYKLGKSNDIQLSNFGLIEEIMQ